MNYFLGRALLQHLNANSTVVQLEVKLVVFAGKSY